MVWVRKCYGEILGKKKIWFVKKGRKSLWFFRIIWEIYFVGKNYIVVIYGFIFRNLDIIVMLKYYRKSDILFEIKYLLYVVDYIRIIIKYG